MAGKVPSASRHPFLFGGLGFFALNLLLFGDVLFSPDRILSSSQADLFLHFAAWRRFGFQELARGHLALWNPHFLCGAPFFGNFETALLYPPNWLYLVLPLALAVNAGILLHVFLSGFFTYLWCLRRGLHPLAAFVAGVVFMLGGPYFLHVYAGHLPDLCTMAWAPLLFLALDGWREKAGLGWALLGVFAVSLQILAGHPQYVYFTAILAFLFTLLDAAGNRRIRPLGNLAAIYAGAFLVTAVQSWTGLQTVLDCGRGMPLEFRAAASFFLPPENLLTLVLPDFFGGLGTPHYWGRWYLWEVSLFMGVGAFFLVLSALAAGEWKRRRWAFILAAASIVLAMGASTPLYRLLYDHLPFFKGIRGVCKFDFLASLFLAVLCGTGLDDLLRSKKVRVWPALAAGSAALLMVPAGYLIYRSAHLGLDGGWARWFTSIGWLHKTVEAMEPAQRAGYVLGAGLQSARSLWMGGGLCALASVLLFSCRRGPRAAWALAALCVLESFLFARSNRPTFELSALQRRVDEVRQIYQRDPGDYRLYGTASLSLAAGGYDIWEDEPMIPERYARFVCYSQGIKENQLFSTSPVFKKFERVFGMLRLKYLVSTDSDPFTAVRTPFRLLPRMLLLDRWRVIPDGRKVLPALFNPAFDPSRTVLLESPPSVAPAPGKPEGKVEWKDLSTDAVDIRADLGRAAILLVTDNYSPGWRVVAEPGSVQSRYQVLPADYTLRAIPLSAGRHHLLLEYRPPGFEAGKWVSILSCILYVGLLVFDRMKKSILRS